MLSVEPLGLDSVMLAEVRTYLRVDDDMDDDVLASCAVAAVAHAEQFTQKVLIRRAAQEIVTAGSGWQILQATPVQSVIGVTAIPAEGATFPMPASAWEAKTSSRGEVYFRVLQPGIAGRVAVSVVAGQAADWARLPESLRLGLLRLTGHFYSNRDSADDAGPPAAALALLLPFRRMQIA
ncbi:head-tail connector protein [Sphingorhabdus sp.]|uniref:head-tail connector protein n=1 Tax=Sphingorhabdus sp. TaxID=1902408 RepID=UPI00391944A3